MAIIKAITSRAKLSTVINYISKTEKTKASLMRGIGCSPSTALSEMELTKSIYNKTDGRQYFHFIYSYSPRESNLISPEHILDNAEELINRMKQFDGYQSLIAVHTDTDHTHAHIVINSVNSETGKKLAFSKEDLASMKVMCNKISNEQGLSVPEKSREVVSWNKYKYGRLKTVSSWLYDIAYAITDIRNRSISREDFINKLNEKYRINTLWKDGYKYITFIDSSGNRARSGRLSNTFKIDISAEGLEHDFQRNVYQDSSSEDIRRRALAQLRYGYHREAVRSNRNTLHRTRNEESGTGRYKGDVTEEGNRTPQRITGAAEPTLELTGDITNAVASLSAKAFDVSTNNSDVNDEAIETALNLIPGRNGKLKI